MCARQANSSYLDQLDYLTQYEFIAAIFCMGLLKKRMYVVYIWPSLNTANLLFHSDLSECFTQVGTKDSLSSSSSYNISAC